jgi:hypothetical protein
MAAHHNQMNIDGDYQSVTFLTWLPENNFVLSPPEKSIKMSSALITFLPF